jgi:hypothetical protein
VARLLDFGNSHFVAGSYTEQVGKVIQGHKLFSPLRPEGSRNREPIVITAAAGGDNTFDRRMLDTSWLPAAAQTYGTSSLLSDYILVDIPIITVPIPNKNMQAFSKEEVLHFDPLLGCQIFKSFRGAATHFEHQNRDPEKAKGVIFDAVLFPIPQYDILKLSILLGVDRTKDRALANDVETRKRTGWSMGALVKAFVCSITNQPVTVDGGEYKRGQVVLLDGERRLCYHFCTGANFFECSSVANPADVTAHGDILTY